MLFPKVPLCFIHPKCIPGSALEQFSLFLLSQSLRLVIPRLPPVQKHLPGNKVTWTQHDIAAAAAQ